jgi:hypothetical protein
MSEKDIESILKAAIGMSPYSSDSVGSQFQNTIDSLKVKIISIKKWTMHAQVANMFSKCFTYSNQHANKQVMKENNHQSVQPTILSHLFLMGDAAHRFPPAGGFGMNTGLQDAHNLAWKLAYVIRGISSSTLLQTYDSGKSRYYYI